MSKRPLVSLLMNSRNAPHYLVNAVRSVLSQSYERLELIVCEASDDEEGVRVVQAFGDPRVVIVRDHDRQGWAHGINLAVQRASGELVLFCAGDDTFHPRAIERMVARLSGSQAGTVVVPVRVVDDRGVPLGRTITVPPHVRREPTWVRLFERNYIVVAMSRREVLPTPLIDESILRVGGDWDLWLRLVLQGSGFTYLDELLFDYRIHDGSLVATEGDARNEMRALLSRINPDAIRDAYERSGLDDHVIEEGLANIAITMRDYHAALSYWDRLAAQDGRAAAQAGALFLLLDDLEASEAMLSRAVRPGVLPEAWNNLGVIHARQGRSERARACFEEALRQFPLYQDARLNLAGAAPLLVTERLLRPVNQIPR